MLVVDRDVRRMLDERPHDQRPGLLVHHELAVAAGHAPPRRHDHPGGHFARFAIHLPRRQPLQLPFLFLSCGWWEHYHCSTDTFERLNLDKMERIACVVEGLVSRLDAVRSEDRDGWAEPEDFDEEEARTLGRLLGVEVPANRTALDLAAEQVLRRLE